VPRQSFVLRSVLWIDRDHFHLTLNEPCLQASTIAESPAAGRFRALVFHNDDAFTFFACRVVVNAFNAIATSTCAQEL
jgi:hypothetical protein